MSFPQANQSPEVIGKPEVEGCLKRASFLKMMEDMNSEKLSRKQLREQCFSLLYNLGFHPEEDYDTMITRCLENEGITDEEDCAYIRQRVLAVMDRQSDYDSMVDEKSAHWKSARIAKVDMAIIRLALYEMLEDDQIPVSVAINEAVRLAKKYSSDQAPAFVNGVLAAFVPERTED